ncbi:putative zinc finger and SCAN domain-containing protein 5D [Paramacrobiotus metropolitanus]|uniref:putative zinc finger and SCAN domain-containing protein 5D n=1 Tax=Paramacrobiotus metropolitanus TaxID=2943436 RepID=UPI002445A328|nr:putative zinc finger and SCAN domain-containing protein 5D [Paramacrobiotus metropolitanus]
MAADKQYAVERIVGKKIELDDVQYLVKWAGYDTPTWEPYKSLANCLNLVLEFESLHRFPFLTASKAVQCAGVPSEGDATSNGTSAGRIIIPRKRDMFYSATPNTPPVGPSPQHSSRDPLPSLLPSTSQPLATAKSVIRPVVGFIPGANNGALRPVIISSMKSGIPLDLTVSHKTPEPPVPLTTQNSLPATSASVAVAARKRNPVLCPTCSATFRSDFLLAKHQLVQHSTEKTFDCRICGEIFGKSYAVANHKKRHVEGKPLVCRAVNGVFECPKCHKKKEHYFHLEHHYEMCVTKGDSEPVKRRKVKRSAS